ENATIEIGNSRVNRSVFEQLEPKTLIEIANFAIQGRGSSKISKIINELSPDLNPKFLKSQLCFTPLIDFIRKTVLVKKWPRDIILKIEEILTGYDPEVSYVTSSCPHFTINYNNSGTDQPPSVDTGGNITMPGTGAIVGSTIGSNGIPDYVEKLCFWLENALALYTSPPFNLRNPSSSGRIPVYVTGTAPGSAGGGSMTIGRNLNDDLLAAVPTHELMHLIQELYRSAGSGGGWDAGMTEGGAVLGEDVVFDTHNRYIVQATREGTLVSPHIALKNSGQRYYLALLLKYISEQQSSRINPGDEPSIGVDTYRRLLERFDIDTYSDTAFVNAVNELPWYQSFYEFGFLDPTRLDETSSETLLGNFWLACYMKDFGITVPDRRFDFMEDEENATWDEIFLGTNFVNTLVTVTLTSSSTLNAGGVITLSSGGGSTVDPFAARFFKVNISGSVDTFRIEFTSGSGFVRPLVQIVLVEPGNVVRDILRSDKTTWNRTMANIRTGTALDHLLIIVSGTNTGGSFTLSIREVTPATDITITRWHHIMGTHYEIDSLGWAWTWVSPDIFVDNDSNGLADDEVIFNRNNKLYIQLHNQGHSNASNIDVALWYQDASGGLSDSAWQPVRNVSGAIQMLTGLTLAAGSTNKWSVDWSPVPSGTSNHFCVRAIVSCPGDPNVDNKRCLSNFGNVIASKYADLRLVRRIPEKFEQFRIDIIPRNKGKWYISTADLALAQNINVKPGEEKIDEFRVRKRAKFQLYEEKEHKTMMPNKILAKRPCPNIQHQSR